MQRVKGSFGLVYILNLKMKMMLKLNDIQAAKQTEVTQLRFLKKSLDSLLTFLEVIQTQNQHFLITMVLLE